MICRTCCSQNPFPQKFIVESDVEFDLTSALFSRNTFFKSIGIHAFFKNTQPFSRIIFLCKKIIVFVVRYFLAEASLVQDTCRVFKIHN